MSEKFPTNSGEVYDEEGRIKDREIAREMAEAEDPFHKKTLGVFPPSKRKLEKGELAAEDKLESILKENIDNAKADTEIDALLPRFQRMREAEWQRLPGYARFREQRWRELDEYIKDREGYRNRQVLLGYLIREIEMHEKGIKKDLEKRAIDDFMNSKPGDKEKGH